MHVHHERLRRKGWHPHEIDHLLGVLARSEQHRTLRFIEATLPFTLLLITTAATIAFLILLTPLVLLLPTSYTYVFSALVGGLAGALHSLIIRDARELHPLKRALPLVCIAILGAILLATIIETSRPLQLFVGTDPIIAATLYAAAGLIAPLILLYGDR